MDHTLSIPPSDRSSKLPYPPPHSSRSSASTPPPPRPYQKISLLTSLMGSLIVFSSSALWAQGTALYQILWGDGGAHFLSQLCTVTLFFWGIGEVTRTLFQLRSERIAITEFSAQLPYLAESTSHDLRSTEPSRLTSQFFRELSRGLRTMSAAQQFNYLEARDLLTASREQVLDELNTYERGTQTAMWLIPLSGFLGTVLGMSETIAQFDALFTPSTGDQPLGLAELAPAIQGLSTAFDTTMLALALVIPLKLSLVLSQRQGEALGQNLEYQLGEPLLESVISHFSDPSLRSDQSQSAQVERELATLSLQSQQLNEHIVETARVLVTLRESVQQHPHLSRSIQDDQSRELTHAHLAQLSEQVNTLQKTLEAPLTVQRTPLRRTLG